MKSKFRLCSRILLFCLVSVLNSQDSLFAGTYQTQGRPTRHGDKLEIDLLQRFNIHGNVRRGKASFHDGQLSLNGIKGASQIVLSTPRLAEYDIQYDVTRTGGDDYLMLGIQFEHEPRHICVDRKVDGGRVTSLRALQGDMVYYPDAYRGDMLLEKDKKTTIVVKIRKDEVGIIVDGKKIYYFKGRSFKLYLDGSNYFGVKEKNAMTIGSWDSQFKISSVVLRPLRNAEPLAWKQPNENSESTDSRSPETDKTAGQMNDEGREANKTGESNSNKPDSNNTKKSVDQKPEDKQLQNNRGKSNLPVVDDKPIENEQANESKIAFKTIPEIGSFSIDTVDVYDLAISPDSELVAIAPRGKKVLLFNIAKRKSMPPIDNPHLLRSLTFGKDASQLFLGTTGKKLNESGVNEPVAELQQWNPVSGKLTFRQEIPTGADDLSYDAKRDVIFVHLGSFATVHGYTIVDGQLRHVAESTGHMLGTHVMSTNRDYSKFASASSGGKDGVKLYSTWDNTQNKPHFNLVTTFADIGDYITSDLAFSDDNKLLAVAHHGKQVVIIDLEQQTIKFSFATESMPTCLAFSPDATRLAVGTRNGLYVYETATGEVMHGVLPDTDYVADIMISEKRDIIVAAIRPQVQHNRDPSTIKVWKSDALFAGAETKASSVVPDKATDQAPKARFRTWTSADGQYKVVAVLVKIDGQSVHLKRKDSGEMITVNVSVLSEKDLKYLGKR